MVVVVVGFDAGGHTHSHIYSNYFHIFISFLRLYV
jgi:hypothetical protein